MTTLVYGGENFAHIGAKFREKWLSHFDKDKWEENLQDAFAETTYAVSELTKPLYGTVTHTQTLFASLLTSCLVPYASGPYQC